MMFGRTTTMPRPEKALRGRPNPIVTLGRHRVLGTPTGGPYPQGVELIYLGMGCFWGAERALWQTPGVWTTAVGFAGGYTPNPTYAETCTGRTGHAEVVLVAYDPAAVSCTQLLAVFWEAHDPTQGMRQGNDVGTTYRSAVYATTAAQMAAAMASRSAYQDRLTASGFGAITTEVVPAGTFYPAETEHQQYLYTRPNGYCSMSGTGVSCPVGLGA